MGKTLGETYAEMIEQILFTIYEDLMSRYKDTIAVKKEIYNIGIEALKNFGAIDPLADKIESLLADYDSLEEGEEKIQIKKKLLILNEAIKIISEKDGLNND